MSMFTKAVVAGLYLSLSATAGGTQSQPQEVESFASENAILDTSLLFAIGAREARQELRGSFGWPTFQEGLVEGVYFRFDPDGYARFSPNARLDTDVFEVVCRPRTFSCMGRKGVMSFMLNTRGQLQLKLENAVEGDRFFIVEGISELEVPPRILQPLDDRMETLLSSSEELIIRRGQNEVERISLVGFSAVSAYLRWIAARQDYTVLPRGWPVPNSAADGTPASLTQVANWSSPMPQPQAPVNFEEGVAVGDEVAEVRGELNVLRELLLDRSNSQFPTPQQHPMAELTPSSTADVPSAESARLAELERNTAAILSQLEMLQEGAKTPTKTADTVDHVVRPMLLDGADMTASVTWPAAPQTASPALADTATTAQPPTLAERLEYLMSEIGLDAKTALMIVEMGSTPAQQPLSLATPAQNPIAEVYQNQVIGDILDELKVHIPAPEQQLSGTTPTPEQRPLENEDYALLSDYFRSVFESSRPNE